MAVKFMKPSTKGRIFGHKPTKAVIAAHTVAMTTKIRIEEVDKEKYQLAAELQHIGGKKRFVHKEFSHKGDEKSVRTKAQEHLFNHVLQMGA